MRTTCPHRAGTLTEESWMHRSVRWVAGSLAGGVVLVVAVTAGNTSVAAPEPSCELVHQQADEALRVYEAAGPETSADRALQLHAVALGSPRCFAADDVELARRAVQQLAPRLTRA